MGRRAKNKQGDPTPIVDRSKPRSAKRKAPDAVDAPARPAKKAKEAAGGVLKKGGKEKASKPKAGGRAKAVSFGDDAEGSEGWEDVDDGELAAESKYVVLSAYFECEMGQALMLDQTVI
jgi:ribosomal RNA methyltransferase Nop2